MERLKVAHLKQNQVGTVVLHGARIVSLVIDARERLCLAQISNSLLKVAWTRTRIVGLRLPLRSSPTMRSTTGVWLLASHVSRWLLCLATNT